MAVNNFRLIEGTSGRSVCAHTQQSLLKAIPTKTAAVRGRKGSNMSALAKAGFRETIQFAETDICRVIVLVEDLQARNEAMEVCDRLVMQFAEELNFVFSCWEVEKLWEPATARQMLEDAVQADILLIAT